MPHPCLIFSQSGYLIQIIAIDLHPWWQTVQIQISWLLKKPTDLDLHHLQNRVHLGSAGLGLKWPQSQFWWVATIYVLVPKYLFFYHWLYQEVWKVLIIFTLANSVDPDQTSKNMTSDQSLPCLPLIKLIKISPKWGLYFHTRVISLGAVYIVLHIAVSIRDNDCFSLQCPSVCNLRNFFPFCGPKDSFASVKQLCSI